jgi:hypothetical protein
MPVFRDEEGASSRSRLRWRHVIWEAQRLHVQRAYTLGEEDSRKEAAAGPFRLPEQPAQALAKLSQRPMFTRNSDLVFCSRTGEHLDGSALRRRFKAARNAAITENPDMPALRFHDLRHTFGTLAAQGFDLVNVQAMMGHADSRTTARYLHARPAGGRGQAVADLLCWSAQRGCRRRIGAGVTPDYSRLLDAALGASIRVEFGTERRAVTNYSVVLWSTRAQARRPSASTTERTASTRCAGTPAVAASSRRRSSTPVPLVRECVRQCVRSRPPPKR